MPVNFSNLVLKPCMDVFAVPVQIDPVSSRPGEPPYAARLIYTTRSFPVQSIDGAVLSDQQTTLGFRFDDFDGPAPEPRDILIFEDSQVAAHGVSGRYVIDDRTIDGQGGGVLSFHQVAPDYPR